MESVSILGNGAPEPLPIRLDVVPLTARAGTVLHGGMGEVRKEGEIVMQKDLWLRLVQAMPLLRDMANTNADVTFGVTLHVVGRRVSFDVDGDPVVTLALLASKARSYPPGARPSEREIDMSKEDIEARGELEELSEQDTDGGEDSEEDDSEEDTDGEGSEEDTEGSEDTCEEEDTEGEPPAKRRHGGGSGRRVRARII